MAEPKIEGTVKLLGEVRIKPGFKEKDGKQILRQYS